MKTLLTLLIMLFATVGFSQFDDDITFNRPANPAPNFTLVGATYVNLNLVEFAEPGAMVGVNMKNIFMIGTFYQYGTRNNNHLYGMYTHINFMPKEYYLSIGLGARWGTYNMKQLTIEPMMVIQINGRNSDRFRLTHNIGIIGGLPSYSFGVIFGNFGEQWWLHPSKSKLYSKRQIKMSQLK